MTPEVELVLGMLTYYSHLSLLPNTPQYRFRRGMEIFEDDGYEATVSELKDNLIGWDCVKMLDK